MTEDTRYELKNCPFCNNKAYMESCDRLITIGCKECNYRMAFNGLLTTKKTDVVASYSNGEPWEYYNENAYEEAVEKWNTRLGSDEK